MRSGLAEDDDRSPVWLSLIGILAEIAVYGACAAAMLAAFGGMTS